MDPISLPAWICQVPRDISHCTDCVVPLPLESTYRWEECLWALFDWLSEYMERFLTLNYHENGFWNLVYVSWFHTYEFLPQLFCLNRLFANLDYLTKICGVTLNIDLTFWLICFKSWILTLFHFFSSTHLFFNRGFCSCKVRVVRGWKPGLGGEEVGSATDHIFLWATPSYVHSWPTHWQNIPLFTLTKMEVVFKWRWEQLFLQSCVLPF